MNGDLCECDVRVAEGQIEDVGAKRLDEYAWRRAQHLDALAEPAVVDGRGKIAGTRGRLQIDLQFHIHQQALLHAALPGIHTDHGVERKAANPDRVVVPVAGHVRSRILAAGSPHAQGGLTVGSSR